MNRERFKDAPWFQGEKPEQILVGGVGGIGSHLVFLLSRIGFEIIAYDHDEVESHNIGGQLFSTDHIGQTKVHAINRITRKLSDHNITGFNTKYDIESPSHYFCFSCFDNMKARRIMFEKWKETFDKVSFDPIFIDGRLGAEYLEIFCVTKSTADEYEKFLFKDEEVPNLACTFKQTSHMASMISSFMVTFLCNHLTNIYERDNIRSVPFRYYFFAPLVTTSVKEDIPKNENVDNNG